MNKAFFAWKPLCLRAVKEKTQPSGNCLRQEVRPFDLSKLAGNRPKQLVTVGYYNKTLYFLWIK